jgi:hypothetical protein
MNAKLKYENVGHLKYPDEERRIIFTRRSGMN